MNISLRLICLTDEIPELKHRLAQLTVLKWETIRDDAIVPYWKEPKCSCMELNRVVHDTDIQQLKKELACISGGTFINESAQEDGVELACYTQLPEILSGSNRAFVTCYANFLNAYRLESAMVRIAYGPSLSF